MIAGKVIQVGAYDYLTKDRVSYKSLSRIIFNTLEKARLKREIKEAKRKKIDDKSLQIPIFKHALNSTIGIVEFWNDGFTWSKYP